MKDANYYMDDDDGVFEEFIEKEGFTPIGDDMYKNAEGEIRHSDYFADSFNEIMSDLQNC